MDPDPTLNFEPGEVIYENTKVLEWVRFWKVTSGIILGGWPAFYTFEIYAGDGAPSLQWISDQWNWWRIPQQFQDGSGWQLSDYRYCDDHDYMNIQYGAKRLIVRPAHTFYILGVLALLHHMNFDYVTKMTYNKDKDLVFVHRPTGIWYEREHVYEMHHLEQMVPSPVTAYKDMTMQREDGILNIYCMSTKSYLKFYGEDKYWNQDLKEDFLGQTRSLWKGKTDKYDGHIFQVNGNASEEDTIMQLKVDRELQEAVNKHGVATPPKSFEDQFFERINQKKKDIAAI